MRELKFCVEGQRLQKDPGCDFSGLVPGSRHYIETCFMFDEDWDNCVCVAEFFGEYGDTDAVLIENGKCEVPGIVLDGHSFSMRIVGKRNDGYYIVTNKIKITQGG